jgi:hypothetical protein
MKKILLLVLFTASNCFAGQFLTSKVLRGYHLNEGTGIYTYDVSGIDDLALTNTAWVSGFYGFGLYFNGTNAMAYKDTNVFDATYLWIHLFRKSDSTNITYPMIMAMGEGGYNEMDVQSAYGAGTLGEISVDSNVGGWGTSITTHGTNYNDNKWHCIDITRNGSWVKIYVDGILKASGNSGKTISSIDKITLGSRWGGTYADKETLDDVFIILRCPSDSEVLSNSIIGRRSGGE